MGVQENEEDWKTLYQEWADRLFLFARQQTRSHADAEDIVHEAFVHVWNRRELFPHISPGLLFTQIRRFAIDRARKQTRRDKREQVYAQMDAPAWFDEGPDPFASTRLQDALQQLPSEQQEVLVLKIWGDQTFEEIGKALDLSPNTAASRFRYGIEALRRELKAEITS